MRSSGIFASLLLGLAAVVALMDARPASALGIYGAGPSGGGPSSLYRLNFYMGAATLVGPIGFDRVSSLDAHPVTQVLYGIGYRPVGAVQVLIRIDVRTGLGTEIGPTGIPFSVSDIAFRPADGKLFAHDAAAHVIYTIDLVTGAATSVGPTGVPGQGNSIEFSVDNILYLMRQDAVFTVNQSTGAASPFSSLTYNPPLPGIPRPAAVDLNFDGTLQATLMITSAGNTQFGLMSVRPVTSFFNLAGDTGADLDAIAVVSRPTAWVTDGTGADGPSSLYRTDLATGALTLIGPTGFDHVGGIDNLTYGVLYGTANRPSDGTGVLIAIDTETGQGLEVGPLGISDNLADLTFRTLDPSVLYGYHAKNDPDHSLYSINVATGAAALVGHTGIGGQPGNGIAYPPTNSNLWHTSSFQYHTLNPLNGVATFQGPVGYIPPLVGGSPSALDYNWNGVLYSVLNVPNAPLAFFDHFTGSFRNVGNMGLPQVEGIAVRLNQNPQTHVTWPNGGESFLEASNQVITWDTFNDPTIRSVDIYVSTTVDMVAATSGSGGGGDLYQMIQGTGATFPIGPSGYDKLGALAAHPVTGDLYGAAVRTGDATPVLILAGPTSYEVGPTGIGEHISDLAFRKSDNALFAYDAQAHNLYRLNYLTGKATLIGSSGLFGNGGNAIAFDASGVLYHANRTHLNTLDPATGAPTQIAPMTYPPPLTAFSNPSAMEFDPASGLLYAVIKSGGAAYLCTIDTGTGVVTLVGNTGQADLDAVAFVIGPASFVAANEPNDGSYAWAVPNNYVTNVGRVLIYANDDSDQVGYDLGNGFFSITSAVSVPDPNVAEGLFLAPLSPNPFTAEASIRYALPQSGAVKLTVHDVRGALTRTLVNEVRPAGEQVVRWDGKGRNGTDLPAGIYIVRLEVGGKSVTRLATLLR